MISHATSPLIVTILIAGVMFLLYALIGFAEQSLNRHRILRRLKVGRYSDRVQQFKAGKPFASIINQRGSILWLLVGGLAGLVIINLKPFSEWSIGIRLAVLIMALYVFYRFPHLRAEQAIKIRRREIERDLPAIIDLLIIMMDAGATFDGAILRLVEDRRFPDRPIKQELKRLAYELSISPDRQSAFEKFSLSIAANDMRLFCSVLVQSEIYGTPVSRGLRGLAHDIRERHYHAVEATGGALGPKLTLPMTLFFLPLIFIVVLAPTVIRAFHLP